MENKKKTPENNVPPHFLDGNKKWIKKFTETKDNLFLRFLKKSNITRICEYRFLLKSFKFYRKCQIIDKKIIRAVS